VAFIMVLIKLESSLKLDIPEIDCNRKINDALSI